MVKNVVDDRSDESVNEVRVVGRLSALPQHRELPSGDEVTTFRVVVPRDRSVSRASVDALECAAWTAAVRRTVARWGPGDTVEVSGTLRRRFFRVGGGAASSRVEIEVRRARRVRRAKAHDPGP